MQLLSCTAPMWWSGRLIFYFVEVQTRSSSDRTQNCDSPSKDTRLQSKKKKITLLACNPYIYIQQHVLWQLYFWSFQLVPVDPKPPAPRSVSSSVWKNSHAFFYFTIEMNLITYYKIKPTAVKPHIQWNKWCLHKNFKLLGTIAKTWMFSFCSNCFRGVDSTWGCSLWF